MVTVEWQEVAQAQELNPIQLNTTEQIYLLQPHRFQGQIYDVETGLHYNRFRYYDLDARRFISHDLIKLLGGDNHYRYAPNPIKWIDIFGLISNCELDCPKGTIDPKKVRFMQNNAKNESKDGKYTVLGNVEGLMSGKLDPNILSVRLFKDGNGKIWTLDHRRAIAFRIANKCMPYTWASDREAKKESKYKMSTENDGQSIILKLGNGIFKEII